MNNCPVFGICGYSGSGKTTLIEALLPALAARQLRVVVVKHDAHGLQLDQQGKDSHRLFQGGADVVAHDPGQSFLRTHATPASLPELLRLLGPHYDLILVEGHKTSPLAHKIWLLRDGEDRPPEAAGAVERVLAREADRCAAALEWLEQSLVPAWLGTPVYGGILIGGKASRMGREKHLLTLAGTTWVERIAAVVQPFVERLLLLGNAVVPQTLGRLAVLPDVPAISGPLAGMLAAMRWQPEASWLFVACDLPLVSAGAIEWLLASRRPGVWATIPQLKDGQGLEPLLAHYDYRSRPLLEQGRRPIDIACCDRVATPLIPPKLAAAWCNINTPEELQRLSETSHSAKNFPDSRLSNQ